VNEEKPNEKERKKLMNLYLLIYERSNHYSNLKELDVAMNNTKTEIQDCIYLFNSGYDLSRKVAIVQSSRGEKRFGEMMEAFYDKKIIGQYFFTRYTGIYEEGTVLGWFDPNELDKMKEMVIKSFPGLKNQLLEEKNFGTPLELLEHEFKDIVGLENVKTDLKDFYYHLEVIKERKKHNLTDDPISLHAVFKGAPGTGKTTMARIYGKLYKSLGILSKGHLVELDRSDLVGEYIGHTESNTKKKLEKALDGILFIDEAYSLKSEDGSNDYGKIAMEVILKFMEDKRDRISVIVAGYNDKMDEFLDSNPGLRSRFTNFYNFPDYTPSELAKISKIMLDKDQYQSPPLMQRYMINFFEQYKEGSNPIYFGNAREVRNAFGELKKIQHKRIYSTTNFKKKGKDFFVKITKKDIKELFNKYGFEFSNTSLLSKLNKDLFGLHKRDKK